MNILIGDISSYKAGVICKFLRERYPEFDLYGVDYRAFTKVFHSKYVKKNFVLSVGQRDLQAYAVEIARLIESADIDVFFPVDSELMENVISNRKLFGTALNYFGPESSYRTLNEKDRLYRLAEELQIKAPRFYRNLDTARTPCVIKPSRSSAAKGVRYIADSESLGQAKSGLGDEQNLVIQEFIAGTGVGYSVFAANGKIMTGYGHKRLAEYPTSGGSSVYRATYFNEEMVRIAEKILKATDWSGFAMFEFKLTPNGEIYLIEVNPRIWGSINQGLQNGINYFKYLLGEPQRSGLVTTGFNTYLSPLLYLSLLRYSFRLNPGPILAFTKNMTLNKPDISLFDDPRGYVSSVLRKII